jgi:hypothetical protein
MLSNIQLSAWKWKKISEHEFIEAFPIGLSSQGSYL